MKKAILWILVLMISSMSALGLSIDSSLPQTDNFTMTTQSTQTFSVVASGNNITKTTWNVNGQNISTGSSFNLVTAMYNQQLLTVVVTVENGTNLTTNSWNVTISEGEHKDLIAFLIWLGSLAGIWFLFYESKQSKNNKDLKKIGAFTLFIDGMLVIFFVNGPIALFVTSLFAINFIREMGWKVG